MVFIYKKYGISAILLVLFCLLKPVIGLSQERPLLEAVNKEKAGGNLGLGIVLGNTTGADIRYWISPDNILDFQLGSRLSMNSVAMSASYLRAFRPFTITDYDVSLPIYVGGGVRMSMASNGYLYADGSVFGTVGCSFFAKNLPIELFVEVRPTISLFGSSDNIQKTLTPAFQIEGSLGILYYF